MTDEKSLGGRRFFLPLGYMATLVVLLYLAFLCEFRSKTTYPFCGSCGTSIRRLVALI
jgi:hypothetical protein